MPNGIYSSLLFLHFCSRCGVCLFLFVFYTSRNTFYVIQIKNGLFFSFCPMPSFLSILMVCTHFATLKVEFTKLNFVWCNPVRYHSLFSTEIPMSLCTRSYLVAYFIEDLRAQCSNVDARWRIGRKLTTRFFIRRKL